MESPATVRDARKVYHFWVDDTLIDQFVPLIGAHAFLVYCYIARRAKAGRAFPGQRRMARDLGVGHATVTRSLAILVEHKLITVTQRRDEHGDLASNEYELTDLSRFSTRGVLTESTPAPTESTPVLPESPQVYSDGVRGVLPLGTKVVDPLSSRDLQVVHASPPSRATRAHPPQGDACAPKGKAAPKFRQGKHLGHKASAFPMPAEAGEQEALLDSILGPAFNAWCGANAIVRPVLPAWDDFVLDCRAHGRCYVSFADAFKNYLKNGYEPAPRHPGNAGGVAQRQRNLEAWGQEEGDAHYATQ